MKRHLLHKLALAGVIAAGMIPRASGAQSYRLSNQVIAFGGTVAQNDQQSFSSVLTVGQPFAGAMARAGGYQTDLGVWALFLKEPDPPGVAASAGDYPDRVQVGWRYDALSPPARRDSLVQVYKVLDQGTAQERRLLLYSDTTYADTAFEDGSVKPGKLYAYEATVANAFGRGAAGVGVGFVNPNGVISGNVTTPAGNPVYGVEVSLTPTMGSALAFDGISDVVEVPRLYATEAPVSFTAEWWLYPEALADGNQRLGSQSGWGGFVFEATADGGVQVGTDESTRLETDGAIQTGRWQHFALAFSGAGSAGQGAARFYRNGELIDSTEVMAVPVAWGGFRIGALGVNTLHGRIDDLRIWSYARSGEEIERDRSRSVAGDTPGLVAYWKFDEGRGDKVYDITENSFDGSIAGARWSSDRADIKLSALTDTSGFYIIQGIWYDYDDPNGTVYTVTPAKPDHPYFRPETAKVVLFSDNRYARDIDFKDESVLPVEGQVTYAGTGCPVEGAEILVDGASHMPPVRTDENGHYVVEFEPATTHSLRPSLGSHPFKTAGGLEAFDFENLTRPIPGADFVDLQSWDLAVSVKGGTCGCEIGEYRVEVTCGCLTKTLEQTTDGQGLFQTLPPLTYTVTIEPADDAATSIVMTDADFFDQNSTRAVSLADTSQSLAFVFRAPMEVEITGLEDFGKPCGTDISPDGTVTVLQQTTSGEGPKYPILIRAMERYGDHSCPVDTGLVVIQDDISGGGPIAVPLTEGVASHVIHPYQPNLTSSVGHPFQFSLVASVSDTLGRHKSNDVWALTEGERPSGGQAFRTTSPETPFFVLHDPPGDGSYSYLSEGTTLSSTISVVTTRDDNWDQWSTVSLGADWSIESGPLFWSVGMDFDATLDYDRSYSWEKSSTSGTENTLTFTANELISTSPEDQVVGDGSDLFIGAAVNFVFGTTDSLIWDDAEQNVRTGQGIIAVIEGFGTKFLYTANHITNTVIPTLYAMGTPEDTLSAQDWETILADNEANKLAAVKIDTLFGQNISYNAGASREFVIETAACTTAIHGLSKGGEWSHGAAVGFTAGGVGAVAGFNRQGAEITESDTLADTLKTRMVGFFLADDDETSELNELADHFTVDVKTDPVYGTPVFELLAGASSNPWEPGTMPRDGVQLTADSYTATDVMPGQLAAFTLHLGNTSQTKEDRKYRLKVLQETNPQGATIRINGVPLEGAMPFAIPGTIGDNSVDATMTVERGPTAYDYEGLAIKLYAEGDEGNDGPDGHFFEQTKAFEVHFVPPCSEIAVYSPGPNWRVNRSSGDSLVVTLSGFNLGDDNLQGLRLEYAAAGENDWFAPVGGEIAVDTLDGETSWVRLNWNVAGLADGAYRIRGKSVCQWRSGFSAELPGLIDRQSPQVLGTPKPADGILQADDEISIAFTEAIDCAGLTPGNAALLNVDRQEEVAAQRACSGSSLILVPEVANRFIENSTLRSTVQGIRDLAGNPIATPVSWEFGVDRNPIYWQTGQISYVKYPGTDPSLAVELHNRSAQTRSFEMTGLPEWLTASPSRGTLAPYSYVPVMMQVSDFANNGAYLETLYAHGTEGDEPVLLDLRVMPQPPDWQVDFREFQYSMSITGELSIGGEVSTDPFDMIGAFVDGQCRGVAHVQEVEDLGRYEVFLTVYSNQDGGEEIAFRVWDALEGVEYARLEQAYAFGDNQSSGTPAQPDALSATRDVIQRIDLPAGWCWFSLNVNSQDMSVNQMLASLSLEPEDMVKGQVGFDYFYPGHRWMGTLDSLDNRSMYMLNLSTSSMLETYGEPTSGADNPIPIVTGWNWIGYIPQKKMPVDLALASIEGRPGDLIKSQQGFAQYVTGSGWHGSLSHLEPGRGYMLHADSTEVTDTPRVLVYPEGTGAARPVADPAPDPEVPALPEQWAVRYREFEHNMTITGSLLFDNGLYTGTRAVVGAFVNGKCRGIAYPQPVPGVDASLFFMMVYGDGERSEIVDFRIYDSDRGSVRDGAEVLPFRSDANVGTIAEPFVWSAPEAVPGHTGLVPDTYELSPNYPNPFNPTTGIGYGVPEDSFVTLEVYNVAGQRVRTLVAGQRTAGYHRVVWNGLDDSGRSLGSGVYLCRMVSGSFVQTQKMVMMK
ncbi:MAG: LamG-like jellyroll fold domain-containing protein [Gemmatimonadota bacterium]